MRWQDLAAVAELEDSIHPESAWSLATWWAELAGRPRRHYVVLDPAPDTAGPVIGGYAGLTLSGRSADVMTVVVAPAYQGRGAGARLLRALHHHAAEAGAHELMLEVRADNEAALALYAGQGYRTVAVRRGYYQPGAVDAIVQRCDLTGGASLPDDRRDGEGG